MIDFAPVFTTGLIVHCKTLEESRSFIQEAKEVLGSEVSRLNVFNNDYLKRLHVRKGSEAAYRISLDYDGYIRVYHSSFSWYREQARYKDYTFIEYSQDTMASYDDVFEEEIDISLLFGGE